MIPMCLNAHLVSLRALPILAWRLITSDGERCSPLCLAWLYTICVATYLLIASDHTEIGIPELMGIADKTAGWEFQAPRRDFWHKIVLERDKHHTVGKVVHKTSGAVLSASTQESAISKQLYSTVDVSAAENIGRILAYRCHCMGITAVLFDTVETPLTSTRNKAFYDALLESGLELEELSLPRPESYGIDYDSLTPEEKRSLYPSLIEELRTTPDWGQQTYPYSLRPLAGRRKLKLRHQVLSKVREGYIWDRFYNRLVKPEHLAAWQVEQQEIFEGALGSAPPTLESLDEPVEPYVPEKWRLD
ncbi:39S ribosomal protein L18, mitochondrial [Echinococcus granulosus]|uniref:39S ribosomal protein L18 mitochondrial n=1 Tax=Echinococcus granulosus TaxID=6210 RepID=A0A068WG02_ECHGR|nr:39S ribosomal protein L18, mitochondrial [Echinococcus granulosus]CDS16535.1 39S ribosomal protein L18 mitochondrial [Echinococcus granulosus]